MSTDGGQDPSPDLGPIGGEADFVLRDRGRRGNRLPWKWSFRGPVLTRQDAADSGLGGAIGEIEALDPYQGAKIRSHYSNLLEMRRVADSVEAFAWNEVSALNAGIESANAALECEADLERETREALAGAGESEIRDLEEMNLELALDAIDAAGRIGRPFDPSKPGLSCLAAPPPPSEQVVAAWLGVPFVQEDESVMLGKRALNLLTAGVGTLVGTGLGHTLEWIEPAKVFRDPTIGGIAALAGCAAAGAAVSASGGSVAEGLAYKSSQAFALGNPKAGLNWLRATAVAAGAFCVMDATAMQMGLFRGLDAQAGYGVLGGAQAETGSRLGIVLVSFIVTGPYVLVRCVRGAFLGRRVIRNQVLAEQKKVHDAAAREFTDDEGYRSAVKALSKVALFQQRKAERIAKLASDRDVSEAREARLRGAMRPPLTRPTDYGSKLVQDVQDRLSGCHQLFADQLDRAFDTALWPRRLTSFGRSVGRLFDPRTRKVRG